MKLTLILAFLSIVLLAFIGWVMNLIDVIVLAIGNTPLGTYFLAKVVGIFIPIIGAILGWF